MRKLIFPILAILGAIAAMTVIAAPAFSQRLNDRVVTTVNAPPGSGMPPLLGVPGAIITLCGSPANGMPCTNFANSYTDATLTTQCPPGYPVVLQGSSSCVNHADQSGAIGFWVQAGCYTYTAQFPNSGQVVGPFALCTGAGGSTNTGEGVNTITISGTSPTLQVTSASNAAIDINYLTLSGPTTAITLPPIGGIADGEQLYVTISQAPSGSPFTLASGTANTPFTAPSGMTLVNAVPGGCPTIGTNVSPSSPSQIFFAISYQASIQEYQVLGCSSAPAAVGVVEFALSAGPAQIGQLGTSIPLAPVVLTNAGRFGNLTVTYLGGTCASPPSFNVFAGSTAGTPLQAPTTAGTFGTLAQTLQFAAGSTLSIQETVVGSGCTAAFFSVSADILEP